MTIKLWDAAAAAAPAIHRRRLRLRSSSPRRQDPALGPAGMQTTIRAWDVATGALARTSAGAEDAGPIQLPRHHAPTASCWPPGRGTGPSTSGTPPQAGSSGSSAITATRSPSSTWPSPPTARPWHPASLADPAVTLWDVATGHLAADVPGPHLHDPGPRLQPRRRPPGLRRQRRDGPDLGRDAGPGVPIARGGRGGLRRRLRPRRLVPRRRLRRSAPSRSTTRPRAGRRGRSGGTPPRSAASRSTATAAARPRRGRSDGPDLGRRHRHGDPHAEGPRRGSRVPSRSPRTASCWPPAADDRTVKLWDPDAGREVRTLSGHIDRVNDVAFTPGRQDPALRRQRRLPPALGRRRRAAAVRAIEAQDDGVRHDRDQPGRAVARLGKLDRTIKIWDLATGQEVRTLLGHSSYVNDVAFSPDGRRLVSASRRSDGPDLGPGLRPGRPGPPGARPGRSGPWRSRPMAAPRLRRQRTRPSSSGRSMPARGSAGTRRHADRDPEAASPAAAQARAPNRLPDRTPRNQVRAARCCRACRFGHLARCTDAASLARTGFGPCIRLRTWQRPDLATVTPRPGSRSSGIDRASTGSRGQSCGSRMVQGSSSLGPSSLSHEPRPHRADGHGDHVADIDGESADLAHRSAPGARGRRNRSSRPSSRNRGGRWGCARPRWCRAPSPRPWPTSKTLLDLEGVGGGEVDRPLLGRDAEVAQLVIDLLEEAAHGRPPCGRAPRAPRPAPSPAAARRRRP